MSCVCVYVCVREKETETEIEGARAKRSRRLMTLEKNLHQSVKTLKTQARRIFQYYSTRAFQFTVQIILVICIIRWYKCVQ